VCYNLSIGNCQRVLAADKLPFAGMKSLLKNGAGKDDVGFR